MIGLSFLATCAYCPPSEDTILKPVSMGEPVDAGTYCTGLLTCPQCNRDHQVMVYLRPAIKEMSIRRRRSRSHSMART